VTNFYHAAIIASPIRGRSKRNNCYLENRIVLENGAPLAAAAAPLPLRAQSTFFWGDAGKERKHTFRRCRQIHHILTPERYKP